MNGVARLKITETLRREAAWHYSQSDLDKIHAGSQISAEVHEAIGYAFERLASDLEASQPVAKRTKDEVLVSDMGDPYLKSQGPRFP